ncbi:MAG TPA: alpha/beta hydrolase [Solirubrobacteraceae bacterium]|nr:alpha/beta hydrolase [Solirubrobacteraceae bacterium]
MVSHQPTAGGILLVQGDAYGPSGRAPWLDVDWREHQRWVLVDGEPVNTIDLGEGPPLLFVHGLSGSWPNWLEQLPVFASEHRVVAPDLPGFGRSPMPREELSIAGYARLLDGLMGELAIPSAAVIGNSMGGFIASELAIAFPERVQRLVLVSAAGISTHDDARTQRALPRLRRIERVTAMAGAWLASHSDAATRRPRLREAALGLVARHPDRLHAALAAEQLRGAGTPGFLPGLAATIGYEIRERLPEIACPTLVVWGENDRLIAVRDAAVFAELIPDSRLTVFADTGHMAMLERPAAFNELMSEFLAE